MKPLNLIIILALALSSTLFAQEPKPAGPTVQLSLIVTDSKHKSLNAITKEDVHLTEDKVEQTVLSVAPDQRPVDLGIAIDASGSMRRLIGSTIAAAKLIVVNRQPKDEIFLERFISTDKVQRLHDFSSDVKSLSAALDSILVEGGQSAIIDAIYTGAQYVAEHNRGADRRKVLVVITDGEDRNSRMKLNDLVKLLHEKGVQIFVVGLTMDLDAEGGLTRQSSRDKAERLLKTLAEETGGRVFFPEDKDDLNESIAQIVHDLQGQFRITYQSSNAELKGFRKVEVKLNPANGQKRKAIVQNGYDPALLPKQTP